MVLMTKVIVEFSEVGRSKRSWTETIVPTESAIIRAIRRKGALASRGIELEWNEDESSGVIVVGGMRTVGYFALR